MHTSRLDSATEQLIERAVGRLLAGRTGVIVAHRLGTVQRVDGIMIIEDGRIREHGQRAQLADEPGSRLASLIRTGLEEALATMSSGLDTLVGPKGLRLSGGQAQRAAVARMFVRDAELLVFDDLSSALAVETERMLWERVFGGGNGGGGEGRAAHEPPLRMWWGWARRAPPRRAW